MFRYPLCLFLICDLCALVTNLAMLGPGDFIYKNMKHCDPELHVVDFWISQKKFNRTTSVMNITLSSPVPIDDDLEIEFKGSMYKEGGYKDGAFYFREKACSALHKMLGDIFSIILRKAGSEECPLPAGDHFIMNFFFDNEKMNVHQIFGDYMMQIFIYKDEEPQSCYILYYDFVPKDI